MFRLGMKHKSGDIEYDPYTDSYIFYATEDLGGGKTSVTPCSYFAVENVMRK